MIIRCPDCTTGFKLPNDQVSEDPIKVRCSKCSHIFKVGLVDDEPILYDEDGERLPDEAQKTRVETEAEKEADAGETRNGSGFPSEDSAAESDAGDSYDESDIALDASDDVDTSDTHIGTGAAGRESDDDLSAVDGDGASEDGQSTDREQPQRQSAADASDGSDTPRSADQETSDANADGQSSDYNPFPHANSDIGPKKSKAITGEGGDGQTGQQQQTPSEAAAAADQPVPDDKVEAERAKVDDDAFRETQQMDPEKKFGDEAAAGAGGGTGGQGAPAGSDERARGTQSPADGGHPGPASDAAEQGGAQQAQQQTGEAQPDPTAPRQTQQSQPDPTAPRQTQQSQPDAPAQQQQGQQPSQPQQQSSQQGPELQTGPQQTGSQQEGDYWDKEPADDEYHDEYFDPESGSPQKNDEAGGAGNGSPDSQGATVTSSPGGGSGAGGGEPSPGQPNGPRAAGGQPPGGGAATGGQATGGRAPGGPPQQSTAAGGSGGPSGPAPGTTGGPGPDVQSTPTDGPTDSAGPDQSAKPKTSTGTTGAEPAAHQSNSWAVDEVDRVDAQQFGSSGFQKIANFLLIVLVVGAGFLTFVTAQNGWFVDFKKFRQMLQVAFQDGEYEPREKWTTSAEPVQPAPPDDPIEFRNVFAQELTLGGDDAGDDAPRVLVLRGKVKNISGTAFPKANVRGLIKDSQGKVIEQQVAPVGANVPAADLESLESPDNIGEKLPDEPTELGDDDTQPFTIVFPSVPDDVSEGTAVEYAVEFEPEKDLPPGGTSGD